MWQRKQAREGLGMRLRCGYTMTEKARGELSLLINYGSAGWLRVA